MPKPSLTHLIRRERGPAGKKLPPCLPEVEFIVNYINDNYLSFSKVEAEAGLTIGTTWRWRMQGTNPTIANVRAILNVLGFDLKIVELPDDPPPD